MWKAQQEIRGVHEINKSMQESRHEYGLNNLGRDKRSAQTEGE